MSAEGKNDGEKPVDRSKRLKLEESEVEKGEKSGSLRSTLAIGGRRGLSPTFVKKIFFTPVVAAFLTLGPAQAATWVLEKADTPDEVSEAQAAEWETKAKEGDWQLKMEFAAAYLYDTFFPNFGCKRLKYGHRCRAMARRSEAGRVFLREVIDTEPKSHVDKVNIGNFQQYYASSFRYPTFTLEKGSQICREKVYYYEQALKNGALCAGGLLESMARYGTCMEKSEEQARIYRKQIVAPGCPKY